MIDVTAGEGVCLMAGLHVGEEVLVGWALGGYGWLGP